MIDVFINKLRVRDDVSDEEADALRRAVARTERFDADRTLVRAGDELHESMLLLDGLICRFKDMRGGARQLLELNVAGDFLDLHAFLLKRLDHGVLTLAPSTVAYFPHDALRRITEEMPHLTRLLWFQTVVDASIHREWVTTLGLRSAVGRLAQLFCEMFERLRIVGLADESGYPLPMTQAEIAELTGMTPVHANRTLKALRDEGLVEMRRGRVELLDLPGLRRVAEFDPTYLSLTKRDR